MALAAAATISLMFFVLRAPLGTPALALAQTPAARRVTSTCAADDPVPTPVAYLGWDRSALVAWETVEQYGGVVPDIEEDRSHAPPAWWRYPSALRSAQLLAAEARDPKGLYSVVDATELKQGDILVRTTGAGACGKMAIVVGQVGADWMTLEADGDGTATRSMNPVYFVGRDGGGKILRPEVQAFRIRVKKDNTLGHVRELRRDLDHLERTIAERPPLIAKSGRAVVDEKVHDLLDEAWSLSADPAFAVERRELAGRALALGAALDWPGAAPLAAAVLEDLSRMMPNQPEVAVSRAATLLLAGDPDKAATIAQAAVRVPNVGPRAYYVLGRGLLAGGQIAPGIAALRRYLELDPADPRAQRLLASNGADPKLAPPPPPEPGLTFLGGTERGGVESVPFDLRIRWPLTWRIVAKTSAPETGIILTLTTERVLLDDGDTQRGSVVIFAQRPGTPAERATTVAKAARSMFPTAKLKPLPPLLPGGRREQFREKRDGAIHQGEVTTLEHNGVVYFLVLNTPARAYPKLKDEYAELVRSLEFPSAPPTTR
ncbi:MAG TPA: hypothetical protein VFH73_22335 [Polyangia bacterium]|nr:hypothetical protein [Polyangia bacterium]